jgi:hypothetical protein
VRAVASEASADHRLGDVLAAAIAPPDATAMGPLIREVADHRLALDQLDQKRLGFLAAGLVWLAEVLDLGCCDALEPDRDSGHDSRIAVDHVGPAGQALVGQRAASAEKHDDQNDPG